MSIVRDRDPLFTPRFFGLWGFAFITFFSAFQLLPAIPFRILSLGGSKAQAGWFLAVYTFSSAFAAPLTGSIADHLGRQRVLISASLLFIVFSIAYGVITNLLVLLAVAAIHGTIWSGILSSSSAIMTDFIPDSRRTEGLAYWGLASTAAIAIAPAAGLLIFHYGWLTLCLELAALSLLMAIAASRIATTDAHRIAERPSASGLFDWSVIRPALSLATISFGYGGITSYAAIVAVERHITPPSIYFSVFAVTIVAVRIGTSHLGDRFGPHAILYPSFVAIPLAFTLLAIATSRPLFVLSAVFFGIGLGSVWPAFMSIMIERSDPRRRARTFGSVIWAFDTGIGAGSLAIGAIGQRWGLGAGFGFAAVLSCMAIPIFVSATRVRA
ncbi:MAG: MFS transporter [Acidobacteriota bacterium]